MLDRKPALKALAAAAREAGVWKAARRAVDSSRGNMPKVNVGKLGRLADEGRPMLVPGKVLGGGGLEKKVTVGAVCFSSEARRKIERSGGEPLSIEDFVAKYRDGKGVLLVGG
ncbi:MAG: 50S ribosomal protein L18e [Nitrososphaerota archaeon]|nr:50S ribosomal protein L18e [Nitrososphaerota archaeon]MDG6939531.1 50S ribosomal protein L18e [Nitrososphaerota archaeon]